MLRALFISYWIRYVVIELRLNRPACIRTLHLWQLLARRNNTRKGTPKVSARIKPWKIRHSSCDKSSRTSSLLLLRVTTNSQTLNFTPNTPDCWIFSHPSCTKRFVLGFQVCHSQSQFIVGRVIESASSFVVNLDHKHTPPRSQRLSSHTGTIPTHKQAVR